MRLIPIPLARRRPTQPHVAGSMPTTHAAGRPARRALLRVPRPLVLAITLVALIVLSASPAVAEPVQVAAEDSIDGVLSNIRNLIMGVAAGLATVMLSIGAVIRMMATGDPGEIERSNRAFKSAGWGYGIAALAPLIVSLLQGIVGE